MEMFKIEPVDIAIGKNTETIIALLWQGPKAAWREWLDAHERDLDQCTARLREQDPTIKRGPLMALSLVCGGHVEYATAADVPNESVPCPCGDPKHWMIRVEFEEIADGTS